MSRAAAVVKSFMFEAGASGRWGFRCATTDPLSTSTTWMLASHPRATPPLTRELMRSMNVTPTAVGRSAAGAARTPLFLAAARCLFVAPEPELGFRNRSSDTRNEVTTRCARLTVIDLQDTFPKLGCTICKSPASGVVNFVALPGCPVLREQVTSLEALKGLRQSQSNSLAQDLRTALPDTALNLFRRITAAEVCQDNPFILETLCVIGQIVEVDVPVFGSAAPMAIGDERALDHQNVCLEESRRDLEDAAVGISGVEKQ